VDTEWEDRDETKGEPWVALDYSGGPITAVMTLTENVFISLKLFGEFVLSAGENKAHCDR